VSAESSRALEAYLGMDEEALLAELGGTLLGSGPGFGPSDIDRALRFAGDWLDQRMDEFRQLLCGDVRLRLEDGGRLDKLADAAAVADALQALLGKPTAFIVAVILLRRGLNALCGTAH
jgi:hypothetical protein